MNVKGALLPLWRLPIVLPGIKRAFLGLALLTYIALASNPCMAAAGPGSLDTNFNVGSTTAGTVYTVLCQPDGKVIVGGSFLQLRGFARFNSDGSLDQGFNGSGAVPNGGRVEQACLYPDGRILIAGDLSGTGGNSIARLLSDGTIDSSFHPGAVDINGPITCISVLPDGKALIGGNFSSLNGQPRSMLARVGPDGTLDPAFLPSASSSVACLAVQPDGKILVGGYFLSLNGNSPPYLARLNPDGTTDLSFTNNVKANVTCLALQPDGKILIGGVFKFARGSALDRLRHDSSWDPGFSTKVAVASVLVQPDGRIIIGGSFLTVNGADRPRIARLYSDGSTDLSFRASVDNFINIVVPQADGKYVVAGGFRTVEGVTQPGLARLYGDDPSGMPVIQLNGSQFQVYQNDPRVEIPVIRTGDTNSDVTVDYATFDLEAEANADYTPISGVLRFSAGETLKTITVPLMNDGQSDDYERFGLALTNPAGAALGVTTNATVFVIGVNSVIEFVTNRVFISELGGPPLTLYRSATNLAASVLCTTLDGTARAGINFSSFAQTVTFAPGETTKQVPLYLFDDDKPGPDTFFSVQLSNPVNASIGAHSNITVSILENDVPGYPAPGVDRDVYTLASTPDGGVILGGVFLSINGIPRGRIGKMLSDGGLDNTFASGTGADAPPFSLIADPDGKIVCAGNFLSYDGVTRVRVLRLLPNGVLDPSFDPYMFSGYDLLAFAPGQAFPQSYRGIEVLLAALFHGGERSEPEWNSAARSCRGTAAPAISAPVAVSPSFGYCVPFGLLLFLRRQEREAGALAQRAVGGVRELVRPSDGLWPVRSPARAAHVRCSKLERLSERRPRPSARISKDE